MECIAQIKTCESKEDKIKSFALQRADMSQCKQSRDISEDKESTNNCCDITKPHETKHCSITFQIQTAKIITNMFHKQSEMSTVRPLFGSHATNKSKFSNHSKAWKKYVKVLLTILANTVFVHLPSCIPNSVVDTYASNWFADRLLEYFSQNNVYNMTMSIRAPILQSPCVNCYGNNTDIRIVHFSRWAACNSCFLQCYPAFISLQ